MIKKKIKAIFSCGIVMIMLFGCGQSKELNEEQMTCEHQWVSVKWDIFAGIHDIYCPKCKLEESVINKEWNKIEADMSMTIEQ